MTVAGILKKTKKNVFTRLFVRAFVKYDLSEPVAVIKARGTESWRNTMQYLSL